MKIRPEEDVDIERIFALNCAVFPTPQEAEIVDALRKSDQLKLSLVAIENNDVVGHIAFSPMGFGDFRSNRNIVALAPMAVASARQKSGIGSRLIKEGLRILKLRGIAGVLLIGHPTYYPRFGFKPVQPNFGFSSEFNVPENVFLGLELIQGGLSCIDETAYFSEEFSTSM